MISRLYLQSNIARLLLAVTVSGANFVKGSDYDCQFDGTITNATFVNPTMVLCFTAPRSALQRTKRIKMARLLCSLLRKRAPGGRPISL